jgi:hypothetical protein
MNTEHAPGSHMRPVRLSNGNLLVPMRTVESHEPYVVSDVVGMQEITPEHPDFIERLAHITWGDLGAAEQREQLLAPTLPLLLRLEFRARRFSGYPESAEEETPEADAVVRAALIDQDAEYLSSVVQWGDVNYPGVPEGLARWRAWIRHFYAPNDPEATRAWLQA